MLMTIQFYYFMIMFSKKHFPWAINIILLLLIVIKALWSRNDGELSTSVECNNYAQIVSKERAILGVELRDTRCINGLYLFVNDNFCLNCILKGKTSITFFKDNCVSLAGYSENPRMGAFFEEFADYFENVLVYNGSILKELIANNPYIFVRIKNGVIIDCYLPGKYNENLLDYIRKLNETRCL